MSSLLDDSTGAVDKHSASASTRAAAAGPKRSAAGCSNCRRSRVKCSEVHPVCSRCQTRSEVCEWPKQKEKEDRRHQNPRVSKNCAKCKERKLKCGGPVQGSGNSCGPCTIAGSTCVWPATEGTLRSTNQQNHPDGFNVHAGKTSPTPVSGVYDPLLAAALTPSRAPPQGHPSAIATLPCFSPSILIDPGEWGNIKQLIRLYFSTVHYFAYLSFIHEADFWERFERGEIPGELSLSMAANALRFGGQMDGEASLAVSDRWADGVVAELLPRVLAEFGVLELMAVLLCQHYEFMCGHYTRGYILVGVAVKMLTFLRLNNLDELPPIMYKPLLSAESLRRLAWSVYFLDATISGGVVGQSSLAPASFTIQLPAEEQPFLQHMPVVTQPLQPPLPPTGTAPKEDLGLGAHLIRYISARQILAGLHSQIQRRLIPPSSIPTQIAHAEEETRLILESSPKHGGYSKKQYYIYKEQAPLFFETHIMRNTAIRHKWQLKIAGERYGSYTTHADHPEVSGDIESARARYRVELMEEAKKLCEIFADAAEFQVVLDPQMAMHAYNGIEILLFQPKKLVSTGVALNITRDEIQSLLNPLIRVMKKLSQASGLVEVVYAEAVNRMIRMGYVDGLDNDDILAVLKKIHSISSPDSEFDFSESFWRYEVSLARMHGIAVPSSGASEVLQPVATRSAVSPNEILLEVRAATTPGPTGPSPDTLAAAALPPMPANLSPAIYNDVGPPDCTSSRPDAAALNLMATHNPPRPGTPVLEDPGEPYSGEWLLMGDVNPMERLQSMFQDVRSRAVSPTSYRPPHGEIGEFSEGIIDPLGETQSRNGGGLGLGAGRGAGAVHLIHSGSSAGTGTGSGTVLPFLDDQMPLMWNYWDE